MFKSFTPILKAFQAISAGIPFICSCCISGNFSQLAKPNVAILTDGTGEFHRVPFCGFFLFGFQRLWLYAMGFYAIPFLKAQNAMQLCSFMVKFLYEQGMWCLLSVGHRYVRFVHLSRVFIALFKPCAPIRLFAYANTSPSRPFLYTGLPSTITVLCLVFMP